MVLLAAGTVDGVTYTVPLAVFDLVPVVLSIVAYGLLAGEVRRRDARDARDVRAAVLAVAGVALIAVGGFGKAVWKVIVATTDTDVVWLDDLLFPALAIGFLLLWGALAGRVNRGAMAAGLVAVAAAALALTVGNDPAEILLLTAMVVGSVGVTVHLIRRAGRARDRTAALLLASSLVVTFVLAGLARVEQTAAMQWIEEGSNALAQMLLLVAVVRLVRSTAAPGDGAAAAPLTATATRR